MKKYLLRYLIFWAPALLLSLFFRADTPISHILQLFFGFFLLFGWAVNTGMAAYAYPRRMLGALLLYTGANLLLINMQYMGLLSFLGRNSRAVTGILSYTPLDIFLQKLLDFKIPHELYITAAIAILSFAGWLLGILYRYHNPDPYRPKIQG